MMSVASAVSDGLQAPSLPLPLARDAHDGALRLLRGMRLHLGLGGASRTSRAALAPPASAHACVGRATEAVVDASAQAVGEHEARCDAAVKRSSASLDECYEIHGEIARGGMGVILRARDRVLGREVALKVLQGRHRGDPTIRRRFVQEARIAARLRHRGIAAVHELGTLDDGRPFFAMELVRGETLAALLDRRDAPARDQRRLLDVLEAVCLAVAHAHQHGVVHLDLKPANVMVGAFGEVHVMDWGIARVLGEAPEDDEAEGRVLGTATFMAPEQARGDGPRIDRRSDVFALGGILLEILSGRPTFIDDDELAAAVVDGDLSPALARLRLSGAPEGLAELVRDCLQLDPSRRLPDAAEVHRRLHALRAQERAARMTRPVAHASRRGDRRARGAGAATVLVVLGILASLGAEGCSRALQSEVEVLFKAPVTKVR